MKPWSEEEARLLKAKGMGFAEIGSAFGVSYYVARSKLDPAWLERRRAQINAARETTHSLGKRDHVRHVDPTPEPTKVDEPDTGPFVTSSGIKVYRQWVPNRTALGSAPMTAKGEGGYVSLPFLSIQREG